ncbi:MAG: hypothetical protein QM784_30085 [Polyangiaceae bacterium]
MPWISRSIPYRWIEIQAPQASQRRRLGVTSFLKASSPDSPPVALRDVIEDTRSLYANYRSTWSELVRAVDAKLQNLTPEGRQAAVAQLTKEFDAIGREPDFEKLCTRLGAVPSGSRPSLAPQNLEGVALAGVRDLAFDFCPSAGAIESVDSLVRFLERMQQVMDVFFRAFISLRDGQRQFETDMAVRRTSTSMPSPAETARTANDLSTALLDWRNSGTEGIGHVESTLADFMIHQVALLNGVMSGVRTLLVEFSRNRLRNAPRMSDSIREVWALDPTDTNRSGRPSNGSTPTSPAKTNRYFRYFLAVSSRRPTRRTSVPGARPILPLVSDMGNPPFLREEAESPMFAESLHWPDHVLGHSERSLPNQRRFRPERIGLVALGNMTP